MEDLRLQPVSETRITNLRISAPEIGRKIAVNMKMAQPQLYGLHAPGEVAPRVARSNVNPRHRTTIRLRSHHHGSPPLRGLPE